MSRANHYINLLNMNSSVLHSLLLLILLFASAQTLAADDYLLGAGDKIHISVYNEPDLTLSLKIDRAGFISYPFIDDFQVIGLSTKQVETHIEKGLLGDYLVNPQVSVSIAAYRPFFIHGEVVKPGGYPYQDDLRLDKAIALAGGLASRASKTDWIITRVVDGKTITLKVNIATQVQPDDIIKIEQSFF